MAQLMQKQLAKRRQEVSKKLPTNASNTDLNEAIQAVENLMDTIKTTANNTIENLQPNKYTAITKKRILISALKDLIREVE